MATHSRGSGIKRVEVVWPEDFVDQIDKDRGSVSRSAWLRQAAGVKMGERGRTVPISVTKETMEHLAESGCQPIGVKAENLRTASIPPSEAVFMGFPEHEGKVKTARQLLAERTAQMRGGK